MSLAFEAEVLKNAWLEWSRQAVDGVPRRSAFTARSTKSFVGNLVIFERRESGFFIRLMGTKVSAVIGEMQGRLVEDVLPADTAARWKLALLEVLHSGKPVRVINAVSFRNLDFLHAEILLAPLLDDGGAQNMIFAAVTFRAGVSPNRPVEEIVAANNNAQRGNHAS